MHSNVLQRYFYTQDLNKSSMQDSNFDFVLNIYIIKLSSVQDDDDDDDDDAVDDDFAKYMMVDQKNFF